MNKNVLCRIGMLAFASLLMLTSCKKDDPNSNAGDGTLKYLVKEVISDGLTTKYEFDSQNRVTKVVYKNSYDSRGDFEDVYSYEGNRVKVTHNGKVKMGIVERGLIFCPSVASEKKLPASDDMDSYDHNADREYYIEGSAKFNSEGKLTSFDQFVYDYKSNAFKKATTHLTWKDGNLIAISSAQGVEGSFEYSNIPNPTNCFDLNPMNEGGRSWSAAMHSKNLPKKFFGSDFDYSITFELDNLGRPILGKIQGTDASPSGTYSEVFTFRY